MELLKTSFKINQRFHREDTRVMGSTFHCLGYTHLDKTEISKQISNVWCALHLHH